MDIDEIVEQLTDLKTGFFPRSALKAAIAQREVLTPVLLRVLEETKQDALERILTEDFYMLPFYALYLLAQFRETRAYPLIVDIMAIPGEDVLDVFDDLITEDLCRILASVSGGDVERLHRLIEDPQVNQYVRDAAMRALVVLVVQGILSRDTVMAYFQYLFRGGLDHESSIVWANLVSNAGDLYPEEVMGDIEQAFADDLVDEMYIDHAWVKERAEAGKEHVLAQLMADKRMTFVEDTVAELEWWDCFQPPSMPHRQQVHPAGQVLKPHKVGRNDPCPCGSGKKYKYCCGKKVSTI